MNAVEQVAELMAVAAITAPKAKGQNFIEVKIIQGEDLHRLADAMIAYGERTQRVNYDRDARGILDSQAVVLIGVNATGTTSGLDCGACGFADCQAFLAHEPVDVEFKGPTCAYRLVDMGIALGSAVKVASMLNVDNRIMYRVGAVARDMQLIDWDFVLGIPLSVSGKNIFFDR